MYPTLYEQINNVGTVPADNGLGILTDCLECMVTEERNGIYELTLEGLSEITALEFDRADLTSINNNTNGYLIVDIMYEDGVT